MPMLASKREEPETYSDGDESGDDVDVGEKRKSPPKKRPMMGSQIKKAKPEVKVIYKDDIEDEDGSDFEASDGDTGSDFEASNAALPPTRPFAASRPAVCATTHRLHLTMCSPPCHRHAVYRSNSCSSAGFALWCRSAAMMMRSTAVGEGKSRRRPGGRSRPQMAMIRMTKTLSKPRERRRQLRATLVFE